MINQVENVEDGEDVFNNTATTKLKKGKTLKSKNSKSFGNAKMKRRMSYSFANFDMIEKQTKSKNTKTFKKSRTKSLYI